MMRFPEALKPGAAIRIVAPASPFDPRLAWRGMGWLAERYDVRFDRGIFAQHGYFAGDDRRRRHELEQALVEPGVHAVLCARGGYGIGRYAHAVDWQRLATNPRWIVGFSDVTALHVEASRVSVASLHSCNLTALGRSDHQTRAGLLQRLEDPCALRRFEGLDVWRAGEAEGPLFGGNLALLQACAAAQRLVVPDGAVLLLEDVTERPYRIDRALTSLIVGGHLDHVAAVVIGEFSHCNPGPDGVTVEEVLADRLNPLGVPVLAGLPVGHGRDNEPVVLGAPTSVTSSGKVTQFATRKSPGAV
jgi:muramoyltetrapeptide carboxypeptidase